MGVVSLFAGSGGSSLGYRLAGFRVLFANEFVEAAASCYEANKSDTTVVDRSDVRELSAEDILNAIHLDVGQLDLLDGSPPCSSFSSVGARAKNWGKTKPYSDRLQRTDDLFWEYARLLDGLKPRYFVAENVVGMTRGMSKGHLKSIVARMSASGYRVQARVLDAQFLGVPQRRRRVILLGTRADQRDARYPESDVSRRSVADALRWPDGPVGMWDVRAQTYGLTRLSDNATMPTTRAVMLHTINYRGEYHKQNADVPSQTITASGARDVTRERYVISSDRRGVTCRETGYDLSNVSPQVRRTYPSLGLRQLSIPELRLLCGYPLDYSLVGSYAQRWERLGRSVPPLMMQRIATSLAEVML